MKKKLVYAIKRDTLLKEIRTLIEQSRQRLTVTVNSELTVLYWNIDKLIGKEILKNTKPGYGDSSVEKLSIHLSKLYGQGWSKAQLWNCLRTAEIFPDQKILYPLSRELTWTHFRQLIYIDDSIKREFYISMCKREGWSTRLLQDRIDSMMYERTAISKRPKQLIRKEIGQLKKGAAASPDLFFRDPYILDFLGLKDTFSENDLESAIIRQIQKFIIEFGTDFAFVARQKRIVIDKEDFYLDLLFYHRSLHRLVAIDLKLGKFKAAYKGQMELYLKWLSKHEKKEGEESPIGLILCAEKQQEQIELLELDKGHIRVAEYMTQLPPRKLLAKKLHSAMQQAGKKKKLNSLRTA